MEIELAKCECCGLKEECTQDYISEVKENFDGKWLCGLCSEAVRDEVNNRVKKNMPLFGLEEALKAHMAFCGKYHRSNPAICVADGMRKMLRRISAANLSSSSTPSSPSSSSSSSSSKKLLSRSSSTTTSASSFSFY
ncbi:unnamed protein product [Cuscuta epithymum]|uniref:Uncharacterized protein n=1 Tax=Cuscuta epithymum TaxID=186058 RepID=A0AAV0FCK9_9ASTE|nr:unnamed protein product [Cuscuta epithymum]